MRRISLTLVLLALTLIASLPGSALAWIEGGADTDIPEWPCDVCHDATVMPFPDRQGPHAGYATTTNKCRTCHDVHGAQGGLKLLPRDTIQATCFTCHDGTGGLGVYGALAYQGVTVGATHRIDTTNTIPGGDAVTGGSATRTFRGEDAYLSCNDCHSPHDAATVDPFSGERPRFHVSDLAWIATWESSHLLRQRPTGATSSTMVYGSDWCLGCHDGRASGGAVHNHPVDAEDTHASPFYYDNVAVVTSDVSLLTTYGTMGLEGTPTANKYWHNRGFVMPDPRTAQQSGHAPICQQCHEDARSVGEPGAVERAEIYNFGDGRTTHSGGDDIPDPSGPASDSPFFQSFPHEAENAYFLVEQEDDLCTNCHPVTGLP